MTHPSTTRESDTSASAHTSNELGSEMNWDAMLPTSPTVKSGMTQRKGLVKLTKPIAIKNSKWSGPNNGCPTPLTKPWIVFSSENHPS